MTDNVQAGRRHLPVDVFPSLPVCWAALTDTETEEEHEALADWIAWLNDRYTLDHRTIPPCWHQHGALIEELSALRTAWLAGLRHHRTPRSAPGLARPLRQRPATARRLGRPHRVPGRFAPNTQLTLEPSDEAVRRSRPEPAAPCQARP
jgi:hypothetical protein